MHPFLSQGSANENTANELDKSFSQSSFIQNQTLPSQNPERFPNRD